jgi:hypothetical protein
MIDGFEIAIVVLVLIGFVILNYRTPVVEGAKFNLKKLGKDIKKESSNVTKKLGKVVMNKINRTADVLFDNKSENKAPAAAVVATALAASATDIKPETTSDVPATINAAAETPLPVDFKEVQGYLDKLKTYSSDAQTMSKNVSSTSEEYKKAFTDATDKLTKLSDAVSSNTVKTEDAAAKAATLFADVNLKATDMQANVNSNNIIKNEIGAKIIEMREIEKNVLGYAIDASMSAYKAKESAERSEKALAGILPTTTNKAVLKSIEGFTGFNSSVLEGYTVFSNPNLPGGSTNKSAFDLENDLVEKINKFNTAYYSFLSENTHTQESTRALTTAQNELNAAITGLKNQIGVIGSSTSKISDASFNSNHATIKTTADKIERLRSDLYMKRHDILTAKDGVPADYNIKHDSAAYTTILWTALATSILYFVFVKIE